MSSCTVTDLRCEYQTNPLGLDVTRPRLSWRMVDDRRGARQTGYQIQAGSTPGAADLWDSGKVESDASRHIDCECGDLASRQRVYWRVKVWDHAGNETDWSADAWFEMGLLERSQWQGEWIGTSLCGSPMTAPPTPMLRRSFSVDQPIASARLYITALGLYEATLNGQPVTDATLAPGWTAFGKRVQYQSYDITEQLQAGDNAIGVLLGDGWAAGWVAWKGRQNYVDQPRLLAQLEVTHEDGSVTTIASDEQWKWSTGPIIESDLYMGTSFDARLEQPGWNAPDFDDSRWIAVQTFDDTGTSLVASASPPVRPIMELPAEHLNDAGGTHLAPTQIFDLGQNMVGRVRLKVRGPRGATIRLRHGEMLQDNGSLYTENLRAADATDYYTLKGEGEEVFEPAFTFHGFRYVEVGRIRSAPVELLELTGIVLHNDMQPTGTFECSEPLINRLQSNIQWGQRGNFLEVPTDCPQRDERMGWTGDAQVFVRTACFNMDVAGFFTKWTQDLRDAQPESGAYPCVAPNDGFCPEDGGPAWAEAGVICPWTIYECFGDKRILDEHYESMERFIEFLNHTARDGIRVLPSEESKQCRSGFGDWLAIDGDSPGQTPTPKEVIGTAYHAYAANLMSKAAEVLGKPDDAAKYRKLYEDVAAAFTREFVTDAGRIAGNTQTCYLLALGFDLLPEELRPKAVKHLLRAFEMRGWHLSTGFVGTPLIAPVLSRFGHTDAAYRILNQQTYPGWIYSILQGATTMWERWNSYTKADGFGPVGMNSFNHYAYGAIGQWMYANVGGLDTAEAGYKKLRIAPEPGGGLTHASSKLATMFGHAESSWSIADGQIKLTVVVPPNTTAEVLLPGAEVGTVTESGSALADAEGVSEANAVDRGTALSLAAGRYEFSWPWESADA
jgi:alpha-L-rhamnosidase